MAKLPRLWAPKPWRAVDYNEDAILRCIRKHGYVFADPKLDGMRCHILQLDGRWVATSREGIEIQALRGTLQRNSGVLNANVSMHTVLDCEVLISGINFEKSTGLLRKHVDDVPEMYQDRVEIHVFDAVWKVPDGCMQSDLPLAERQLEMIERLERTDNQSDFVPVHYRRVKCTSVIELNAAYDRFRRNGFEGAVYKDPSMPYRNGKVTGWWKRKPDLTVGGVVVGLRWGDAGKANEGLVVGFEVELEDGSTCVATGLTQEVMHAVTAAPSTYIARAIEVKAMERTAQGNLRHPKFNRWRDTESTKGIEE